MPKRLHLEDMKLSSAALKIIAVVTMLVDHFGYAIYRMLPQYHSGIYEGMRDIGRISFPIFAFFIVEGFLHTGNVRKYMLRLLLFSVLSEVPYDLAFHGTCFYLGKQNIYFTLCLGLIAIYGVSQCMGFQTLNYVKQLGIILIATGMATALQSDYEAKGVLLIVVFYYIRFYKEKWFVPLGAIATLLVLEEPFAMLAFPFLYFYNGKRGLRLKYVFYMIYPIHLLLFGYVRYMIQTKLALP